MLPSTLRPLAFELSGAAPSLVLENFSGEPLARLLGAPMAVERFLKLAIHIASAVADIHLKGTIHKNIHPQDILVDPVTLETRLVGLGYATRIPSEKQPAQPLRLIEGVLPYLSPEQTGRMNRAIDTRSDLYAVGVVFYQMLTGRLPFEARDPLEWVHCHIARTPSSPSSVVPGVPEVISRIIMKLLAKLAEDRYQSARGLRADLERCLVQWTRENRCTLFALGEDDLADRFSVPEKLYGRETELATLLGGFERVASSGIPELIFVAGRPGIGKSTLVNELWKPLVRDRGLFVGGKFDQNHLNIPFATITQAFRGIALEILAEPEERLAAWKSEIKNAVGVNGRVAVDVIPQLESVIGEQPPVPDLPPAETKNRFLQVFQELVAVFAKKEHPVTIFLDDMQWVDVPTLQLLRHLLRSRKDVYLYVVCAFRDTEIGPTHPLRQGLEELRKTGTTVSEIALGPLSLEELTRMVADSVHRPVMEAEPLGRLVYDKTAGNPFFAAQLLKTFYEERLIERHPESKGWRWNLEKILAKSYTDDVIELMIAKVRRLSAASQETLKLASCLGNTATVRTLARVCGQSEEALGQALWELVREGILLLTDGHYKFLHDRIQQAAYLLIPEEQRTAVHLRIGRLLRAHISELELDQPVFQTVNQFNRAAALLEDPREREDVLELNCMAGKRAKASIAFEAASRYFEQARAFLPPDAWGSRYGESLSLGLECAECEYLLDATVMRRRSWSKFSQTPIPMLTAPGSSGFACGSLCMEAIITRLSPPGSRPYDCMASSFRRS